jgi:retron-type reverse transcriptase
MTKKAGNLLASIADPDNLRLAFWKARKGKSYSTEVETYRKNVEANLFQLRSELLSGAIHVGQYRYFKIYDPKERQICASAFGEQVLHHALMNCCHDTFERWQIWDSYASRKDKGTYAAIEKAKSFTRRYTWFLKLDVRKFFESIAHDVLKHQLRSLFKDASVLGVFDLIIDSYEAHPKRGVPIGNLTSQYFANHYLCSLDHFIKEQLRIKAYVRYMDDMILWDNDKEVLQEAYRRIKAFVETQLRCELKPPQLNYTSRGLPFLGYKLLPYSVKLTQRSKQRFIKKMRYLDEAYQSGLWSETLCQRRVLPLLAFVKHADSQGFVRNTVKHQRERTA